jgi:hypothetical protein
VDAHGAAVEEEAVVIFAVIERVEDHWRFVGGFRSRLGPGSGRGRGDEGKTEVFIHLGDWNRACRECGKPQLEMWETGGAGHFRAECE